ncbi:PorACj family cell wall channel-forming small protein [Corynebacterium heidelbergense]|nr:PorACj family cell wall channel-forming small protein [Corynebacterium heidelbergense]WCZ35862.1 hypothetical protein CHEID_01420 [Corynebacterium heidelbergense]
MGISDIVDLFGQIKTFISGFSSIFGGLKDILGTIATWAGAEE